MAINNNIIELAVPEQSIDKMIALYSGAFTASTATKSIVDLAITSPKSVACLPELLWSTDGGTTWIPPGVSINGNLTVTVGLTASNARFYIGRWKASGGPDTITYKLYLIWPR